MSGSKDDLPGCSGCGGWIPDPVRAYGLNIQLGIGSSGVFTRRAFCSECFAKIDPTMDGDKVDRFVKEIDRIVDFLLDRTKSTEG